MKNQVDVYHHSLELSAELALLIEDVQDVRNSGMVDNQGCRTDKKISGIKHHMER